MSDSEGEDRALLERWRHGDAAAGGELVRRHHRHLSRFLISRVGQEALDDLAQSVYETLARRAGDVRPDTSVKGFMFGIARHKVMEHYRGKRKARERVRALDEGAPDQDATTASQRILHRQQRSLAVQALRQLSLDDQMLLQMSVDLGLTRAEIAEAYGDTPGQIGGRIHRARARLRAALESMEAQPALIESTATSLSEFWRDVRERGDADSAP